VGLKKKPSTSEVLDWLKLLTAEEIPLELLQENDFARTPPLMGALIKSEQDSALVERRSAKNVAAR
jgi:hypothetical protein